MNRIAKAVIPISLAAAMALMSPQADARSNSHLLDRCETAIKSELGEGRTRIERVRSTESDGTATFWLKIRHKGADASASVRYRALCEVSADASVADLELETGSWKKGRRGQAPIAVD
ncbi:MAG: hypothetical protein AAF270_15410 [Pseudomonadota bacterium]